MCSQAYVDIYARIHVKSCHFRTLQVLSDKKNITCDWICEKGLIHAYIQFFNFSDIKYNYQFNMFNV